MRESSFTWAVFYHNAYLLHSSSLIEEHIPLFYGNAKPVLLHYLCHNISHVTQKKIIHQIQNFNFSKNSPVDSFIWYLTTWVTEMALHRQRLLLYCILSSQCLSRDSIYSCKHTKVHVLDLNGKLFFVLSKIKLSTHLNKHVCQWYQCECGNVFGFKKPRLSRGVTWHH